MRLTRLLIVFICCIIKTHCGELVHYSFDENSFESGPDTFSVFQNAGGSVRLSSDFRFSGYQSVELKDTPNDKDFPELQGYFPIKKSGVLYIHFALMIAKPKEDLNIALAGPAQFQFKQDGISIWLSAQNGMMFLKSSKSDKLLFKINEFVWYLFDLEYQIEKGVFNLQVSEEHSDKIVDLKNESNSIRMPKSAVDKFSFIGDHPQVGTIQGKDSSSTHYFVDDIIIQDDSPIPSSYYAAPGRKKLFIDSWYSTKKDQMGKVKCFLPKPLTDLGLEQEDLRTLKENNFLSLLTQVIFQNKKLNSEEIDKFGVEQRSLLTASQQWMQGCKALAEEDFQNAKKYFIQASETFPRARIFQTSQLIPFSMLKQWDDFDKTLEEVRYKWDQEDYFLVILGRLSIHREGLATTVYNLSNEAINKSALAELYFASLLWSENFTEALSLTKKMLSHHKTSYLWMLYRGDISFYLNDFKEALNWYEQILKNSKLKHLASLRLSDTFYKLGNTQREREYREVVYGKLSK